MKHPVEQPRFGPDQNKSDVHETLSKEAQLSRDFLNERAAYARHIQFKREADPEEVYHHQAHLEQAYRIMQDLPFDVQQVMELVHPLDGSEPVALDEDEGLARLAVELGTDPDGVRRLYSHGLEQFGARYYSDLPS